MELWKLKELKFELNTTSNLKLKHISCATVLV